MDDKKSSESTKLIDDVHWMIIVCFLVDTFFILIFSHLHRDNHLHVHYPSNELTTLTDEDDDENNTCCSWQESYILIVSK